MAALRFATDIPENRTREVRLRGRSRSSGTRRRLLCLATVFHEYSGLIISIGSPPGRAPARSSDAFSLVSYSLDAMTQQRTHEESESTSVEFEREDTGETESLEAVSRAIELEFNAITNQTPKVPSEGVEAEVGDESLNVACGDAPPPDSGEPDAGTSSTPKQVDLDPGDLCADELCDVLSEDVLDDDAIAVPAPAAEGGWVSPVCGALVLTAAVFGWAAIASPFFYGVGWVDDVWRWGAPCVAAAVTLAGLLVGLLFDRKRHQLAIAESEERTHGALRALAGRREIRFADHDPLEDLFARLRKALDDELERESERALTEQKEALERDAHVELVRARSQCEVLVEKHVQRIHAQNQELLDQNEKLREEKQALETRLAELTVASEASQEDHSKALAEQQARFEEQEVELSATRQAVADFGEARQALELELQTRDEECERYAEEVEALLERIAEMRAQRLRFYNLVTTQLRDPLQRVDFSVGEVRRFLSQQASDSTDNSDGAIDADIADTKANVADDLEKAETFESTMEALDRVGAGHASLQRLIDQLLDLSRLESGSFQAVYSEVDLRDLAREVVMDYRPNAKREGVELSWAAPNDLPQVRCDGRLCRKILSELIDNGLRYTPRGGRVSVTLELSEAKSESDDARKAELTLTVQDSGRGVGSENHDRIFEAFTRCPSSLDPEFHAVESAGLGLTLVQGFVRQQGGEIELESADGEGTVFRVRLPIQGVVSAKPY